MTDRIDIDLDALKRKLHSERGELEHDAQITADERGVVVLDQTSVGRLSRMDALQNQAMQLETERRREVELQRIDAALKRMEDGEYGYCVSCGEDIAAKRLDMDPATPVCVECARKGH
ncbi:MAG: TraR/DksA C4-type zinc finger protein [Alphaproteobacteria bacterium]|nr:TraR/DksA C4-type zinc finger protein [Alphaproteobacteria bacterium]MBF0250652.1 TraR/DksA C4-type zinc finger protein [Alphaproteobacteria bacterium]